MRGKSGKAIEEFFQTSRNRNQNESENRTSQLNEENCALDSNNPTSFNEEEDAGIEENENNEDENNKNGNSSTSESSESSETSASVRSKRKKRKERSDDNLEVLCPPIADFVDPSFGTIYLEFFKSVVNLEINGGVNKDLINKLFADFQTSKVTENAPLTCLKKLDLFCPDVLLPNHFLVSTFTQKFDVLLRTPEQELISSLKSVFKIQISPFINVFESLCKSMTNTNLKDCYVKYLKLKDGQEISSRVNALSSALASCFQLKLLCSLGRKAIPSPYSTEIKDLIKLYMMKAGKGEESKNDQTKAFISKFLELKKADNRVLQAGRNYLLLIANFGVGIMLLCTTKASLNLSLMQDFPHNELIELLKSIQANKTNEIRAKLTKLEESEQDFATKFKEVISNNVLECFSNLLQ